MEERDAYQHCVLSLWELPLKERQPPESCQQVEKNVLKLCITEKEAAAIAVDPHIYA